MLTSSRGRKTGKRVQANMGAKNHAVIMPDGDYCHYYLSSLLIDNHAANKNLALNSLIGAAFGGEPLSHILHISEPFVSTAAGQRCMALSVGTYSIRLHQIQGLHVIIQRFSSAHPNRGFQN